MPGLDWIAFDLIQGTPVADLAKRIVREVPQLRRYARALTRNSTAVDDLVQESVERALPGSTSGKKGQISRPGSSPLCIISMSTRFVTWRAGVRISVSPTQNRF
jgi:hypothetical protein